MGWAVCRFNGEKGCEETGSKEWHVYLADLNKSINVPSMWKHYMIKHLVQPTAEEREIIMAADSLKAIGELIGTRSAARPEELMVLYVENTGKNKYTHEIGDKPDIEFINQLERILAKAKPWQTKGIPGYR
jgi:hypothetical protein